MVAARLPGLRLVARTETGLQIAQVYTLNCSFEPQNASHLTSEHVYRKQVVCLQ
jgi:hypothetical protein